MEPLYNHKNKVFTNVNIINAIDHTTAQQKLEQIMAQVCDDKHPVIITRNDQPSVVIISLEDYQSLEETLYLLKSYKNA